VTTAEKPAEGAYVRQAARWRERVEIEPGRYHLFVSLACPWAQRTLIVRRLAGIEADVPVSVLDPIRDDRGWAFIAPDPTHGWRLLSEAYLATDPAYDGRISVPVLWDLREERIACNESADVIVSFNAARRTDLDLYPEPLRPDIDAINEAVYTDVNDGVYKCGFAKSQAAYDAAVERLFARLDELDRRLGERRYLAGDRVTLADWRLFTTLLRFDAVYHTHFKATRHRLIEYPNLWPYARELFQWPGVRETVDFNHIRRHYYLTHHRLNPTGILPTPPAMDWDAPPGRG
jgi:glutathionyl-hydroquinone reductase